MRTDLRGALLAACLCLTATAAHAIDYRSVAENAVLYEKPATESRKRYIVAQGTPVEVVLERNDWARVRLPQGSLAWIRQEALSSPPTVMITSTSALIRENPDAQAPGVLEVTRQVVLELLAPPEDGWVHVRHRDGAEGYVRVTDVWGL